MLSNTELAKTIGINIRNIRNKKHIKREDVAYSIGMSMCTLGNIELGKVSTKINTLNKIAKALDVDIIEFFNLQTNDDRINIIHDILTKLINTNDNILLKYNQIINILTEK